MHFFLTLSRAQGEGEGKDNRHSAAAACVQTVFLWTRHGCMETMCVPGERVRRNSTGARRCSALRVSLLATTRDSFRAAAAAIFWGFEGWVTRLLTRSTRAFQAGLDTIGRHSFPLLEFFPH